MKKRKVVLYIASSLDGVIAKPDDDLSFLDNLQHGEEDYGYHDLMKDVDTVILGRRTFMWVKEKTGEYPHQDKEVFVVTRRKSGSENNVTYWPGSLRDLVDQLQAKEGGTIYCDGGAAVVNEMLRKDCLDEIILSVAPVILGEGIRLFHDSIPERKLKLIESKSYPSGIVQLTYEVEKG